MRHQFTSDEHAYIRQIVTDVQPDEVELVDEMSAFRRQWPSLSSRGPVGYGAEAVIDLITPYAIVVGAWAWGVVHREVATVLEAKLKYWTRRALGRRASVPPVPSKPLSIEEVESEAARLAEGLGMEPGQAKVLAAAIAGRLRQGRG